MPWLLLIASQALDPAPQFERLPNGLQVALVEDHTYPLVSVQLWFAVGSADDPPGTPGLCHVARALLEHREDAALRLRAGGARFESATLRDACYFASLAPAELLDYVLEIEARRGLPAPPTADALDRAVAAARLAPPGSELSGDARVEGPLLEALLPDRAGRFPPGTVSDSFDVPPERLDEFLQRRFAPAAATLFVIGDFSPPVVRAQVRARFGAWAWRAAPRRAQPEPLPDDEGHATLSTVGPAGVHIAWRTPRLGAFDNAALDVLMARLCNPVDGTLCQALTAGGFAPPRWNRAAWRDSGALWLASDDPQISPRLDALERLLTQAIEQAALDRPDEVAHDRARALVRRRRLLDRAAFRDYAFRLAQAQVVGGDLLLAEFEVPQVARVSVADVQRAAALLQASRRRIVRVEVSPAAAESATAPRARQAQPVRLDPGAALRLLARSATNAPAPQTPRESPGVEVHALGRGASARLCRLPGAPIAYVATWAVGEAPSAGGVAASWTPSRLMDYLSYRGGELDGAGPPFRTFVSDVEPALACQMLELHAAFLAQPGGAPMQASPARQTSLSARQLADERVDAAVGNAPGSLAAGSPPDSTTLFLAGDLPADVVGFARAIWGASPAAPIGERPPAATQPAEAGAVQVSWVPFPSDIVALRVVLRIVSDASNPPDLETTSWLFGAPEDLVGLDGKHAWRWRSRTLGREQVVVSCEVAREQVAPEVAAILARAARLTEGREIAAELASARRMACASRLTSLDSPARIGALLASGTPAPWEIAPAAPVATRLVAIPAHIVCVGGTAAPPGLSAFGVLRGAP